MTLPDRKSLLLQGKCLEACLALSLDFEPEHASPSWAKDLQHHYGVGSGLTMLSPTERILCQSKTLQVALTEINTWSELIKFLVNDPSIEFTLRKWKNPLWYGGFSYSESFQQHSLLYIFCLLHKTPSHKFTWWASLTKKKKSTLILKKKRHFKDFKILWNVFFSLSGCIVAPQTLQIRFL